MHMTPLVWLQIAKKFAPTILAITDRVVPSIILIKILTVIPIKDNEAVYVRKAPENSHAGRRLKASKGPDLRVRRIDPRQHYMASLCMWMLRYGQIIAQREAIQKVAQF
jgi:hypothetical protein